MDVEEVAAVLITKQPLGLLLNVVPQRVVRNRISFAPSRLRVNQIAPADLPPTAT
jgi:hypothetical protein